MIRITYKNDTFHILIRINKINDYTMRSIYIMATYLEKIIGDIGRIDQLFSQVKIKSPIAVVNAANAYLQTGAGVTGALVRAVGGSAEWKQLVAQAKNINDDLVKLPLEIGDAVYTPTQGQLLED